jgi:DivIVA domain-containing protein
VFFDVLGWILVAVAVINAVPKVRRLLADPAERDRERSRARSKDWAGVRQSVILAATGLTQLPMLTGRFRWPLDVSLALLAAWELAAMYWSRKNRSAEAGPAESAPEPAPRVTPRAGRLGPLPLPAAGAGGHEVAAWVDRKVFSTTRLRPGYDEEEVDVVLDAIRDAFLGVRAKPLTPGELRSFQFSRTRLRPGYDEAEVDTFLYEVEARLAT